MQKLLTIKINLSMKGFQGIPSSVILRYQKMIFKNSTFYNIFYIKILVKFFNVPLNLVLTCRTETYNLRILTPYKIPFDKKVV